MFWSILLSLFFIFTPKVLADNVSVSWKSIPSSAAINTQFDLQIKVTGTANATYYLRADDGTACTMQQLKVSEPQNWSNSCNVGVSEMQSITLGSDGTGENIVRLKEISSSGSKTLYSYVYDSNRSLLATSPAGSITINATTPTPAATSTPTPTPTSAVTATPTPTKILTPTPTEPPVIEPTSVVEPTIAPVTSTDQGTTEAPTNSSKKSGLSLPVILIILGLILFIGPVIVPKIVAKIKSGKRRGPPPIIPPKQITEISSYMPQSSEQIQPTSIKEVDEQNNEF